MVSVTVNGTARSFDGDADMPLLWYLRDVLQMTGTNSVADKPCAARCTVHLDGAAVRACVDADEGSGRQVGDYHRGT